MGTCLETSPLRLGGTPPGHPWTGAGAGPDRSRSNTPTRVEYLELKWSIGAHIWWDGSTPEMSWMAPSRALASPLRLLMALPRSIFGPFTGLFDLAEFHRPRRALFDPFQASLRSLSFPPGLLSIPKGRAQEYFTLAPEWAGGLLFRVGFAAL